ncbi:uncharacterized protein [Haliotis cracherodii]|uniref:uncharacterized protein LOC124110742 n=1 Tax=Haliotis rufescens TaxID=6454 RepID=UPI001EB00D0D|nr:uncharacterized protein LOC124110742 [Haliotis rufescens]
MASNAIRQLCCFIGIFLSTLSAVTPRPPSTDTATDTFSLPIRSFENQAKRSCDGFPCMYSHLGAKAGRQALMRTLMSIIDDCAVDPSCSPGRRRRKRMVMDSVRRLFLKEYVTSL